MHCRLSCQGKIFHFGIGILLVPAPAWIDQDQRMVLLLAYTIP